MKYSCELIFDKNNSWDEDKIKFYLKSKSMKILQIEDQDWFYKVLACEQNRIYLGFQNSE